MRSAGLLLALAAAATAWVVPNQQIFAGLQPGAESPEHSGWKHYSHFLEDMKNELDASLQALEDGWSGAKEEMSEMGSSAISSAEDFVDEMMADPSLYHDFGEEELSPHIEHPPHKSDKTIYKLLSESKHTTKFAKLLEEHEEFKKLLDKADANVTVFVPSDHAFERIPDHAKKPPKEFIEAVLKFHIVPETYPAQKIFGVHTLPTLLEGKNLSSEPSETPQRLSVKLGWKGLFINGYNRITHRNIFASNGVIHGVDTFNVPPPPAGVIISFVPTAFSQFELGMLKTGLAKIERKPHLGATVFAPANSAWKGLGIRANAFLFSHWGRKYLRALLKYHIVANHTLYSDKFYGPGKGKEDINDVPKGRIHLDLPTLLKDKTVSVDVGRYGRFIDVHVNHYSKVVFQDAIAHDGVVHVINRILIPPHHKKSDAVEDDYDGGEIDVEELKERLEPFVDNGHEAKHGFAWDKQQDTVEL